MTRKVRIIVMMIAMILASGCEFAEREECGVGTTLEEWECE
jgi:hypothetical protein